MRKSYFSENLSKIRSHWRLTRTEMSELLGFDQNQLGNIERGSAKVVPAEIVLQLENFTSIPAKLLYFEDLKRDMIPANPLVSDGTNNEQTISESDKNKGNDINEKLTIIQRLERLEEQVFGG